MKIFRFIVLAIIVAGFINANLPVYGVDVDEYNKAVEAYRDVLLNPSELFGINLDEVFVLGGMGEEKLVIRSFAVLYMDGDNIPSVIIWTNDIWNGRIVLHHNNENDIVRNTLNYRVGDIKKDGTYVFNGAPDWISQFQFINGAYEEKWLARTEFDYSQYDSDGNPYIIEYYVYDKKVSETEYDLFYDEQNKKESLNWYEFNNENINKYLTPLPAFAATPKTGDDFVIFALIIFVILGVSAKALFRKRGWREA